MAAFTLGIASLSHADVVLPKVIDSHMILQRGVAVPVWGWADQGEAVTVEFSGQSKTATPDASGKWMVKLDPLTASTESRVMTIAGNNTLLLEDVLVGEVWLARLKKGVIPEPKTGTKNGSFRGTKNGSFRNSCG
jgi:sialate O-acetylesterase